MAVVTGAFFDTSVLLGGLIDVGPSVAAAQRLMASVAARRVRRCSTAWHCCLEFYSVSTRLPPRFRLSPPDARLLLEREVLGRFQLHDLPADDRQECLALAARDHVVGGRVYDLHIGEIARSSGASVVVTDNRRHFSSLLRHGIRVVTAAELLADLS